MTMKPDSGQRTPEAHIRSSIDSLDPKNQKLMRSVRAAVRKRFPTLNELAYDYATSFVVGYSPTERGIDGIVAIAARADGLRLYFGPGVQLTDPKGLLEGSGRQTRFVRMEAASWLAHPDTEAFFRRCDCAGECSRAFQGTGHSCHQVGLSEAAATQDADEVTAGVAEATWRRANIVP